jgi:serine/threonine-protein kinase
MKKVTKILMIVVAVIVAIGVIFGISKAVGGFMPGKVVTEEKEKKVSVPDIRGMTEEEARKALTKKNIGYQSAGQVASDKYEKGEIAEQDPKPGEKVKENSTVTVKISSGPAEKTAKVPDVTGKSEADAQKQLEDKGFVVASETDYSDSVPQGYVISTNPTAGTEWAEGNTVTMVVSMGKEKISVPDVSGADPDSAQTTLQGVGLTLGSESSSEYSDEYEEGTIIRTVPAAGEQVEKGTTVNYVLSKGKKTETVEVPTLSGLTRSQAEAKLSGLGLTANVTESYDSTVTKGYVISQSVTPGSQIEKGATVDIVVSLGPENVTPDPPTDGDNNNGNDSGSNGGSSSGANH